MLLALADPRRYSLRQVAYPSRSRTSYLSKVERGLEPPPGETTAIALARELQLDPDLLLAMAVKFPPNCKPLFVNAPSYSLSLFARSKINRITPCSGLFARSAMATGNQRRVSIDPATKGQPRECLCP